MIGTSDLRWINTLQMRGFSRQYLVISLLVMMVCVQTFAMHFHFPGANADHHAHAHAHVSGIMDADHPTTGHDDEAAIDIPGAIVKQTLSIDIFVFVLLAVITVSQTSLRIRKGIRRKRPRYYLLFFRPPLRAPPL